MKGKIKTAKTYNLELTESEFHILFSALIIADSADILEHMRDIGFGADEVDAEDVAGLMYELEKIND